MNEFKDDLIEFLKAYCLMSKLYGSIVDFCVRASVFPVKFEESPQHQEFCDGYNVMTTIRQDIERVFPLIISKAVEERRSEEFESTFLRFFEMYYSVMVLYTGVCNGEISWSNQPPDTNSELVTIEGSKSVAPVSRLHRRSLSVEQPDNVSSPSAPSTPTKKRSARLAAKLHLDNIDENAPVSSPARVTRRRSTARDLMDPAEEKPMTPTRRAAARVRSTSITSEVTVGVDSPRAKRALRRNSLIGSDTEGPTTPARPTRRTRKDSNSSVENLADTVTKTNKILLEETISEEPESRRSSSPRKSLNESVKSPNQDLTKEPKNNEKSSPNVSATEGDFPGSLRKSARIAGKQGDTSLNKSGSEMNTSTSQNKNRLSNSKTKILEESKQEEIKESDPSKENPNPKTPVLKSERQRTKSWAPASELDVSDKKNKTHANGSFNKKQRLSNSVGAGDTVVFEASVKRNILSDEKENTNNSLNSSRNKKKGIKNKSFESDKDIIVNLNSSLSKKSDEAEQIDGTYTVDYLGSKNSELNRSAEVLATEKFLQQSDGKSVKCTLFVEDTDSNDVEKRSQAPSLQTLEGDDQCVPVVNHNMNNPAPEANLNSSVEPMDVDVTIPDDVIIPNFNISKKNELINESDTLVNESKMNMSLNKSTVTKTVQDLEKSVNENKSTLILSQIKDDSAIETNVSKSSKKVTLVNKSKINMSLNKSTVTKTVQDLEKSVNENKSTLILSQIKDDSAIETNVSKSSKKDPSSPSNTSLTEKGKESKNNSLAKEETPFKNKNIKKLGIQTSTPVVASNEVKKMDQSYSKNTSNILICSRKSEPSESSEDENSKSKSALLDDEPEDAGDDYESGDSQDESERRYAEENEIVVNEESLKSTDEDVSNDSDYEKDSFVVSSDEELLSGSGDDLSLTANELTMSAKSKKKYDEKKRKEQKKASREMFEARHQEESDDEAPETEKKKNRMRLESANISSADESLIKTKKNNKRLRIDSSQDLNLEKSLNEDSNFEKKKKKLNTSGDITNEHEISAVVNDSINKKTDPLKTAVKIEPKTPQKLDISTVNVSARYDMEEVDVNDMTVIKANETTDPLQAREACDDDSSSLSENEEIKQNYELMLSRLNNSRKKPIKDLDSSLHLIKKSTSEKQPIMDQLNLTQTKNTKKTRKESVSANEKKSEEICLKLDNNYSSCNLQLLFPDDGDESDHDKKKNKKSHIVEEKDDLIPLKKTEGKTDLRKFFSTTEETESKPTPRSNKNMSLEFVNTDEIDSTTATELTKQDDLNISLNKKNKKNKKLSLSEDHSEPLRGVELTQIATPGSSQKKKNGQSVSEDTEKITTNLSQVATQGSGKKKKNRHSVSEDTEEVTTEVSQMATPGTSKKNKSVSKDADELMKAEILQLKSSGSDEVTTELSQVLTPASMKKKKNKQTMSVDTESLDVEEVKNLDSAPASAPKSSSTKKTKRTLESSAVVETASPAKNPLETYNQLMGSHKKNSTSQSLSTETAQGCTGVAAVNTGLINSKKRKRSTETEEFAASDVKDSKPRRRNKRARDEDGGTMAPKQSVFKSIQISRLPTTVIDQLDAKLKDGNTAQTAKAPKIVSTSAFTVEQTTKRKNIPSQYLEESIYLSSNSPEKKKRKKQIDQPKVLPFIPTVSTSGSGFTTNFQVNVLAKETKFVAQLSNMPNFKTSHLQGKNIKKMGTYEMYKRHRNVKMSKF